MSEYEWWCPHCRVTHPPGRRVCLHCGGPVQRERGAGALPPPTAIAVRPPPATGEEADEDDTATRARPLRVGVALAWLALALLGTLLRLCQEGGR
jgi:hypothetical protein